MDSAPVESPVRWYVPAAVTAVLLIATLDWVGWATGVSQLTRIYPTWPQMTPWTALWLAALATAVQLQWRPTRRRVLAGRALTAVVGVLAVAILAQYVIATPWNLDHVWFGDAVRTMQSSWPGRPSPQTATSAVLLAATVFLMRLERRWVRAVWPALILGGAVIPFNSLSAYLFNAMELVTVNRSTGQAMSTALALLLLISAAATARPDRLPTSWLLARPDWQSLVRLMGVLAGLPLVVALSRPIFTAAGFGQQAVWSLSIAVGTLIVGALTFYVGQREQRVLIDKERVSRERAELERRYRILAENAVDVIVHLRDLEVVWVSPSVELAFGEPASRWIGASFPQRIHPDDLLTLAPAVTRLDGGEAAAQRFRLRSAGGDYRWVDGHGKPYVDADGRTDGLIAALRLVDDAQVEAEQRLEQLARFDALTGLANRAEALRRLESALEHPVTSDARLGVLFCDVDHFKDINDTWGHVVGDTVLITLAGRIGECVRHGDTVGRTGGDEILVLLPGIRDIEEADAIAAKIRCRAAQPIYVSGNTIRASLSIGATVALPGEPVSTITARADAAMYRAKWDERNSTARAVPLGRFHA